MSLKKCFYGIVVVLLTVVSCDNIANNTANTSVFEESGETALPTVAESKYKTPVGTGDGKDDHRLAKTNSFNINWNVIEPLLKQTQKQLDKRSVAIYSSRDTSQTTYHYRTTPLEFSDQVYEKADGKMRRFYFETTFSRGPDTPVDLLIAYIPDHQEAVDEMMEWIRSKTDNTTKQQKLSSNPVGSSSDLESYTCYNVYQVINDEGEITDIVIEETTCYIKTTEKYEDEDDSGGSNNEEQTPCSMQLVPDPECSSDDGSCNPPYPCGDGGGGGGNNTSTADLIEQKIIDDELDPCMKGEKNMLTTIGEGTGSIIQDFAIDELHPEIDNFNWKMVQDGDLPDNKNARTLVEYNTATSTVTTKFDSGKFENATDLSVARTILHEAVHAWVVSISLSDSVSTELRKELLGDNWIHAFENDGHNFIASDYITDIADALQAFGNYKGYNASRQFYEDMAWGGLFSTHQFENKDPAEQQRIQDVVLTELTGRDSNDNYQTQKGNDAGC